MDRIRICSFFIICEKREKLCVILTNLGFCIYDWSMKEDKSRLEGWIIQIKEEWMKKQNNVYYSIIFMKKDWKEWKNHDFFRMMFFRVWNGSLWLILHLFISLIYHLPYLFFKKRKRKCRSSHSFKHNSSLSLSLILESNKTTPLKWNVFKNYKWREGKTQAPAQGLVANNPCLISSSLNPWAT